MCVVQGLVRGSGPAEPDDDSEEAGGAGGEDDSGGQGGDQGGQGANGGEAGEDGAAGEGGATAGGSGGSAAGAGQGGNAGAAGATAGAGGAGGAGGNVAAGGMGGTPVNKCGTLKYCNDFESETAGQRPAMPLSASSSKPGNSVTVDASKAFSGGKSVRMESVGLSANISLSGLHNLREISDKVSYVRFMMFIDGGTDIGSSVAELVGPAKIGDKNVSINLSLRTAGTNGSRLVYWATGHDGVEDCMKNGGPGFPTGKWACVELKIDEKSPQPYGYKLDGKEVFSFSERTSGAGCGGEGKRQNNGVWYVPNALTARIGWMGIPENHRKVTMWVDDLAFDVKPIGCPAPK